MPTIHPTSIVDTRVQLADDVVIGPNCVLQGDIKIGKGSTLIGNCYLTGKLLMGENNVVYPYACIGFAAQDVHYSHDLYEPGIVIGNNNTFREGTTVHRGTQESPTTIGNDNLFMTTSHVGHDAQIGNNVTIVTNSALGGHVHIHDRVLVGGGSCIHQFVTVGKGAMLAGGTTTTYDILPYFLLSGYNNIGSVNIVGMRRSGMDREEITKRKDVFKMFYRSNLSQTKVLQLLEEQNNSVAQEYIDAVANSRRGIVPKTNANRAARRGSFVETTE
ncbi:MAG: acyl-ACP--UDP-N-acetylglucosamine O-acyltransferase [Phycisphaerales bacterium]|jgi:UDP-N-acetylglucosamine acyltransferase|nr:acyl-ACP--UDP-N-acetylglucosamine O-acyltransferase [Phycisphaerales bacterium]